jgi:hypothetical protein
METQTRETQQTVIFLAIPAEVGVRAGPVTVLWPGHPPVEAEVLGADFTGPDAVMREREAVPDLLDALRKLANEASGVVEMARECIGNTNAAALEHKVQAARAAIARATAPTPEREG